MTDIDTAVWTAPTIAIGDILALPQYTIAVLTGCPYPHRPDPVRVALVRIDVDGQAKAKPTLNAEPVALEDIVRSLDRPGTILTHLSETGPVDLFEGLDRTADIDVVTERAEQLPAGAVLLAGDWSDPLDGLLVVKDHTPAGVVHWWISECGGVFAADELDFAMSLTALDEDVAAHTPQSAVYEVAVAIVPGTVPVLTELATRRR